ncbi:MAG: DNA/RNA non-specific endonuclease [Solirubrobacterales bacterium]|nr:DNA/RNA non-specific endonuclease [Solirubrobacterales bacterium]
MRRCTHFSLSLSASRRLCRWVAWNIDGTTKVDTAQDRRKFELDPAYEPDAQVGAAVYADNPLDQGHIAAFSDVSWGDPSVAAQARRESCYFSNITPQLDSFNRSDMKGIWGQLENEIAKENKLEKQRLSEFGGPILGDHDLDYRNVLVPREFWKLVVFVDDGALRAKGFRLTQRDLDGELGFLPLDQFRVYQQAIAEIGQEVGLDFGIVTQADTAPPPSADALLVRPSRLRRIDRLADVNVAGW